MDKRSFLGLLLISGIMFAWILYMSPSKESAEKQKKTADSLATLPAAPEKHSAASIVPPDTNAFALADSLSGDSITGNKDSLMALQKKNTYGEFANASQGEEKVITIENELLKASISTLGGRPIAVELKNYRTYDSLPLNLFDKDSARFALKFSAASKDHATDSMHFSADQTSITVSGDEQKSISLKLYTDNKKGYIEYVYALKGNSYLLDFTVNIVGMENTIMPNQSYIGIQWQMNTPSVEKSAEAQANASTIYYKPLEEEADFITETKDESLSLKQALKWIALKQQFFTCAIISEKGFDVPPVIIETKKLNSKKYIKNLSADFAIPYGHTAKESVPMQFYFGPNHYQTLKELDLGMEKLVPLGWGIFGWVNRFIVIPLFNFLNSFNLNYGIVILILTLVIKTLLFPIAYKTHMSSAKMRVLKPEIDEINKKFGKDDPMKKQQAVMSLYKKAGVNPLAGCIPVLLQMPILIALFRFFPASIELRQQKFLWADDLSAYDSILDLSFNIPFYGDHVSLFTLLMTISTIIYTYSNSQLMGTNSDMPQMKVIMYLMPIMFLGFFNNYSAGLSYYYFLANMITFGQTSLMRRFVDEEGIRKKIEENKKKPAKQSNFQKRLEKMVKDRQEMMKQGQKKK